MIRLLLALVIFLSTVLTTFPQPEQISLAQNQDESPFIYYFSINHQVFLIERADGTDSWLLGEGIMPDDHTFMFDTRWSPSGKWFAWWSSDSWRKFFNKIEC